MLLKEPRRRIHSVLHQRSLVLAQDRRLNLYHACSQRLSCLQLRQRPRLVCCLHRNSIHGGIPHIEPPSKACQSTL